MSSPAEEGIAAARQDAHRARAEAGARAATAAEKLLREAAAAAERAANLLRGPDPDGAAAAEHAATGLRAQAAGQKTSAAQWREEVRKTGNAQF